MCFRITHSYLSPSLFHYLTFSIPFLVSEAFQVLSFTLSLALSLTQYTDTHFWWPFGSKRSFKYSFCYLEKKRPLWELSLKSPYHDKPAMSSSNAAIAWEWLVGPSACEVSARNFCTDLLYCHSSSPDILQSCSLELSIAWKEKNCFFLNTRTFSIRP